MTLDTSDPSIKAAYLRIRHHENNENWFVLGYGDSRNKLTVLGSGAGGIDGARDLLGKEVCLPRCICRYCVTDALFARM